MTIRYHAVLIDECGQEFGADVLAETKSEAYEKLRENYPESRIDQIEDDNDTARRQAWIYERVSSDDYDYEDDL